MNLVGEASHRGRVRSHVGLHNISKYQGYGLIDRLVFETANVMWKAPVDCHVGNRKFVNRGIPLDSKLNLEGCLRWPRDSE